MKRLNITLYLLLLLVFVSSCNESLEDTYKDYTGDGKIRYLSICSDLTVKSGWNRVELRWKNGVDETVSNIKVTWTANDVTRDTILEKNATYVNIKNLVDGAYKFEVYAINGQGNKSLTVTNFGRPYTENHEAVRTFTMAVIKHYKLSNSLVMFMDRWNETILEINLNYTDLQGNKQKFSLTREVFDKGLNVLENVDVSKDVTIDRRGKLEGCDDEIVFGTLKLDELVNLSSSFKSNLLLRYGLSDKTTEGRVALEHFLETTEVLELDYDLESFDNILYCKNLKKLILGKNRYLHPTYTIPASSSTLAEKEESIKILDIAHDLLGLTIDRYAKHYLGDITKPYLTEKGIPVLPDLTILPASDVKEFKNSVAEIPGYDSNLKGLFDGNTTTWWEPIVDGAVRRYEISVELKEVRRVDGFKFVQYVFDPTIDRNSHNLLPNLVRIQVSKDKLTWNDATYLDENTLGRGPGEVTLLKIKQKQTEVKYIKIVLYDQSYTGVCGLKIADIMPYSENN